jgi:aryl-alcohol dehydrogenase-like predicted oxidoreductase
MKRRIIPKTELECSYVSLGGVPLGSSLNEEDSFRLMDIYSERGGNMLDTAEVYSNWLPIEKNISEKIIGKWMRLRNNRDTLIVTTKGAHPHLDTMQEPRLSRNEITLDLEGSMQRLQVEVIDLYWLHRDDPNRPVGDIMETMNSLVKDGKIRYFGCSNWTTSRIKEAQQYAKEQGISGFSANQMLWNYAKVDSRKLSDPTMVIMDEAMKQFHLESGMAAIPYASQARGLFSKWETGYYDMDDERISGHYKSADNIERFHRLKGMAAELSLTVTQLVLAYLTSHPFVTIPILGCYTAQQLDDSLTAEDIVLSTEQLNFMENGI